MSGSGLPIIDLSALTDMAEGNMSYVNPDDLQKL
jgi:hypothetical protein